VCTGAPEHCEQTVRERESQTWGEIAARAGRAVAGTAVLRCPCWSGERTPSDRSTNRLTDVRGRGGSVGVD